MTIRQRLKRVQGVKRTGYWLRSMISGSGSETSDEDAAGTPISFATITDADPASTQPHSSPSSPDTNSSFASTTTTPPMPVSPLTDLPVELLLHIFSFCAANDPDAPFHFSRVCREWYDIAYSVPALWPHLRLSDTPNHHNHHGHATLPSIIRVPSRSQLGWAKKLSSRKMQRKAALWTERSAARPLDITLDGVCPDSTLPMLSHVLPVMGRWRDITYYESRMRFLTGQEGTGPAVVVLHITLYPLTRHIYDTNGIADNSDEEQMQLDPEAELQYALDMGAGADELAPPPISYANAGQLSTLSSRQRIREIYVLGVRRLPVAEQLTPFMGVRGLNLMNGGLEANFPMHDVVPFLDAFPMLEMLALANFSEILPDVDDDAGGPVCNMVGRATLPRLHRLSVRGICAARCVLVHIDAPILQTLMLVHINNVTRLPTVGRGGGVEPEPGDSEDEANDFSRSPWTDHSTGMGLRRLFARPKRIQRRRVQKEVGEVDEEDEEERYEEEEVEDETWHPPLRELIMDYADMRTKDFIWIFARLTHLELFDIVASDMSDNVIRALEVRTGLDDDHSIHVQENDRSIPPAPSLPSLKKLRLTRCQKVSGDVFVRMIASRVRAAQAGLQVVAMLTELRIIECLQITTLHHLELQQILAPVQTALHHEPGFGDA